jgi:hypothetical protein
VSCSAAAGTGPAAPAFDGQEADFRDSFDLDHLAGLDSIDCTSSVSLLPDRHKVRPRIELRLHERGLARELAIDKTIAPGRG